MKIYKQKFLKLMILYMNLKIKLYKTTNFLIISLFINFKNKKKLGIGDWAQAPIPILFIIHKLKII